MCKQRKTTLLVPFYYSLMQTLQWPWHRPCLLSWRRHCHLAPIYVVINASYWSLETISFYLKLKVWTKQHCSSHCSSQAGLLYLLILWFFCNFLFYFLLSFCLLTMLFAWLYLFPESTSVYTKYKVLMLHHGVTESSPSGRCQQYFSSGRHLAAAARVTLATIPAGMGQLRNPFRQRAGRRPRWRPTYLLKLDHFSLLSINGLQYHIQPPLNSRKFLIRILRTRPKTYDNSVNTFQANLLLTLCLHKINFWF